MIGTVIKLFFLLICFSFLSLVVLAWVAEAAPASKLPNCLEAVIDHKDSMTRRHGAGVTVIEQTATMITIFAYNPNRTRVVEQIVFIMPWGTILKPYPKGKIVQQIGKCSDSGHIRTIYLSLDSLLKPKGTL